MEFFWSLFSRIWMNKEIYRVNLRSKSPYFGKLRVIYQKIPAIIQFLGIVAKFSSNIEQRGIERGIKVN